MDRKNGFRGRKKHVSRESGESKVKGVKVVTI